MPVTLRVQRVKGAWLECRHDSGIVVSSKDPPSVWKVLSSNPQSGHFMCKECSLARWVPVNSQENLEKLQVGGG